ncbi:MAG: cupin domain-containing protein, partial [Gemmatimonadetes bacterium]|nr:cupin domain-containing protein [Gemmatimonadota bacterium]NIQ52930.1 cupin domain-containing protein [Gemmatimonadota bacterium]NIU73066.1 cupin domain-containing protein [Gammaproteobacteria bacterium]NIX43399.1 cupin domain-containing protein [Gemmatimonadota bacterium]NIY07575.1 cupin domain-containing protein [Gemmatimonadota bacterium]
MEEHVTRTTDLDWMPLIEEGVKTEGISVKILRFDERQGRPPTFLLRFEPGASYPNHNHPGGEEVYVLEGEVRFGP